MPSKTGQITQKKTSAVKSKKVSARKQAPTKTPTRSVSKKAVSKKVTKPKLKTKAVTKIKKTAVSNQQPVLKPTPIVVPEKRTLLLSPLKPMQIAMLSRVAGVCFVLAGGFFSLWHLPNAVGMDQLAAVNYGATTATEAEIADIESELVYGEFTSTDTSWSGEAKVVYYHDTATAVEFLLYADQSDDLISLGTARQVNEAKWQQEIDTSQLANGTYKLIALGRTTTDSFEDPNALLVQIDNNESDHETDPEVVTDSDAVLEDDESVDETETISTSTTNSLDPSDDDVDTDDKEIKEKESDNLIVNESDLQSLLQSKDDSVAFDQPTSILNDNLSLSELEIEPAVVMEVPTDEVLQGVVEVLLAVPEAIFIELYARRLSGGHHLFVGLAKQQTDGTWRVRFDTTNVPDGTYTLQAKVKNQYGLYEHRGPQVEIANPVAVTPTAKEQETFAELSSLGNEFVDDPTRTTPVIDSLITQQILKSTSTQVVADEVKVDGVIDQATFDQVEQELNQHLNDLRLAIRDNNSSQVAVLKKEMRNLATDLAAQTASGTVTEITTALERRIAQKEQEIEKQETIIRDRVGVAIHTDTDNDGITDYDEINIYQTDPLVADTDRDGIIDGAEVAGGFDPVNALPEAAVKYASPKEEGEVRPDILAVTSLTTVAADTSDIGSSDGVVGQAVISGIGLPNSFVTIYIFSTPVVVTVKTDETGAWTYAFEKELEDGTHEVYVGISDNAGKIIAKSEPLIFVKEAAAFTPVDAAALENTTVTPAKDTSLSSTAAMLLVASISIVAMGIVLILLGLYIDRREHLVAEVA